VEVHQFAATLSFGDAISDEMIEIQRTLREHGYKSDIFIKYYDPRVAEYIKDFREYEKISSKKNIVIFHFSIGSPVSKLFFRIPDKKIMIYHNITPYHYFIDHHRILTKECFKGRLELKRFSDKVDLALGDSEFNRIELEESNYRKTGILPLLLNLSKFDEKGDPVVTRIFDNGKTTILFVGRVIPNKKFEDVIKTFYFYKKYFNPDSQLILAGDYRSMERYYFGLTDLVARLDLNDVYFTGRLEFAELLAYYNLAHFYLSLSEHEGFGVPLIEAFYKRIPVIAYAAGAVEETLNGGGIIIRNKEFHKIAALIDVIDHDPSLREYVVSSQLKALKKYKRENVNKILIGHIRSLNHP
jgi:L-malate glycosyltransferase